MRASVGCMLMGERGLCRKLTGRKNLEFSGALYHLAKDDRRRRAQEILHLLELDDDGLPAGLPRAGADRDRGGYRYGFRPPHAATGVPPVSEARATGAPIGAPVRVLVAWSMGRMWACSFAG